MGRKKFNMDPKKVPLFFVVLRLTFTFIFPFPLYTEYLPLAGHPVLGGERAGQTHGRGHRSVPVQGRRPQQDCHRRLPGGEVPHADNFIRLSLLTHQPHIFFFFFLSHRDDFNIKVLQAFVDLHEFTDLNLVQALR